MKKPQINPEDLLKDIDLILNNIELLEKKDLNIKEIIGVSLNIHLPNP